MNNQSLIEGIARHDRMAIRYLLHEMQPVVLKYLLKKGAGEALAEDIFMDAIEALYREISAKGAEALIMKLQQPRDAQLQTYVIRICLNLFYKSLRKNKVQTGVTSAQELEYMEDESVSTYLHQVAQRRLYEEKLNMLDTSCQEVLAMFFKKISMREIAKKLGTSEPYAKKKKFNCKSKLIEMIRLDTKYQELIN